MPRKGLKAKEKRVNNTPDPVYKSVMVTRFVNKLLIGGEKSKAEKILYKALDKVKTKTNEDPMVVFKRAIENVRPLVEVKARRVGGATYQVPSEVREDRSVSLAFRWIISYSRAKSGRPMSDRLADEILSASKKEGPSFKKKEDTHKMAEANKAFAHYRW